MSSQESPDQIERDIDARREDLANTLEALQDRAAPERLVEMTGNLLQSEGRDIATAMMRRAQRNPVALAMVVAGLAWLTLGPDQRQRPLPKRRRHATAPVPVGRFAARPNREPRRPVGPRDPVPAGRPGPGAATAGE